MHGPPLTSRAVTSPPTGVQPRLHYLDWLRVLAVLLLIPFHTARIFDSFEPFYIKSPDLSEFLTWAVIAAFSTWHMPLLFLVAGAGSYLALSKRSWFAFGRERTLRLLVPLVLGVLVLVPPQAYVGAVTNAGFEGGYWSFLAGYFSPDLADMSGYFGTFTPGQLWFILFLLVYSFAALPLLVWCRRPTNAPRVERACRLLTGRSFIWFPVLVLWLSEAVPDIGGKNLLYYFLFFLAGAAFASSPSIQARVARWWGWTGLVAVISGAAVLTLSMMEGPLPDWSLGSIGLSLLRSINSWAMLVLILGSGGALLNRPGPALVRSNEAAYPFYLLHQTVIVLIGWWVVGWGTAVAWQYLAICALSLAGTAVVYAVFVRPWNPVRWLFGMKAEPRARPAPTRPERA